MHACPTFSIPQDIYVIDLPPYFGLCLSREFIAKIGGYLSSDWTHMIFRTRYGTKVNIQSEVLARDIIEPDTPSTVNTNYVNFGQDDCVALVTHSSTAEIPNILLDE